jgi:hypothetical protein
MLEEHVRFELARWQGEALAGEIRQEAEALFAWLAGVRLGDLLPAQESAETISRVLDEIESSDEAAEAFTAMVTDGLIALRGSLRERGETLGDLLDTADLHRLVDLLSDLDDLRGRLIEGVTDNPAYHELVAHVLYHGVKAFMLSENPVARRVPGAQSLIRLGQRGLQSAAPRLESGVDRQLSRFVAAQVGDTLSDSKQFLDQTLTGASGHKLLDTVWRSVGPTTLSDLADVVDDDELSAVVEAVGPVVRGILRSGVVAQVAGPALHSLLTTYADRDVAGLLADLDIDAERVADQVSEIAAPALEHAAATGYLEERIRSRLAAFYLA